MQGLPLTRPRIRGGPTGREAAAGWKVSSRIPAVSSHSAQNGSPILAGWERSAFISRSTSAGEWSFLEGESRGRSGPCQFPPVRFDSENGTPDGHQPQHRHDQGLLICGVLGVTAGHRSHLQGVNPAGAVYAAELLSPSGSRRGGDGLDHLPVGRLGRSGGRPHQAGRPSGGRGDQAGEAIRCRRPPGGRRDQVGEASDGEGARWEARSGGGGTVLGGDQLGEVIRWWTWTAR